MNEILDSLLKLYFIIICLYLYFKFGRLLLRSSFSIAKKIPVNLNIISDKIVQEKIE